MNWSVIAVLFLYQSELFYCQELCETRNGLIESNFTEIFNKEISPTDEPKCLIRTFVASNKMECFAACNLDCFCFMLMYVGTKCNLYKQRSLNYLTTKLSKDNRVYEKK